MRLYLDICCLKRPFDSQEQALVRLEAETVATILALPPERVALVRTPAQTLENGLNPVRWRREAVATWLHGGPIVGERFRKKAERLDPPLRVRVTSPLVVAQEIPELKT